MIKEDTKSKGKCPQYEHWTCFQRVGVFITNFKNDGSKKQFIPSMGIVEGTDRVFYV